MAAPPLEYTVAGRVFPPARILPDGRNGIASDVIVVSVRIEHVANRFVGELRDLRKQRGAARRRLWIDEQYTVDANLYRGVAAWAGDHVDAAAHVNDIQSGLRTNPKGGDRHDGRNHGHETACDFHRVPAFNRPAYSGYMDSAPPRAASGGRRCFVVNSCR